MCLFSYREPNIGNKSCHLTQQGPVTYIFHGFIKCMASFIRVCNIRMCMGVPSIPLTLSYLILRAAVNSWFFPENAEDSIHLMQISTLWPNRLCIGCVCVFSFMPNSSGSQIPNYVLNTLRPRHLCPHITDDILKYIFLNENVSIWLEISLNFVPMIRFDNIAALVRIKASEQISMKFEPKCQTSQSRKGIWKYRLRNVDFLCSRRWVDRTNGCFILASGQVNHVCWSHSCLMADDRTVAECRIFLTISRNMQIITRKHWNN